MSKGSGEPPVKEKKANKNEKKNPKAEPNSGGSATASGRGERDRAKWRMKRRREEERKAALQKEQQRKTAEADLARRRAEIQKKEFRRRHEVYEKTLIDADSVQKAVETVMGDYRESRNAIKVQLCTDSNDFIQTQQFEKAQLIQIGDRIRNLEAQLATLELELSKTKKFSQDYAQDSLQNWFVRFWKFLY